MRNRVIVAGILLAICGFMLLRAHWHTELETEASSVIPSRTDAGYATSAACVSCHPSQHDSWHASFHRTMTQWATPETVLASTDDVRLSSGDQTATWKRRGDEFWVNTVDQAWEQEKFAAWNESRTRGGPDPFANLDRQPPRVDAQIVMTTGSHHFQVYWYKGPSGRELWQFPWRYHVAAQRWVHRKDVFLAPPQWRPGMWFRVWNNQCIFCHSTGPYPGKDQDSGIMVDTKVAELGIACESCHGPAAEHIAFHSGDSPDGRPLADTIVQPARLPHRKSSQICGACHSHFQHSDPLLWVHGPQFRPGDNLHHFGWLMEPQQHAEIETRFWGDGTNRSGGREFSGMAKSACYLRGKLSCVRCHSMHNSDPNDQLAEVGTDNQACLQCHEEYRDAASLTQHTHHLADSTGSECYNCHMPHTNYALFKATRSHRVDVPRVAPLASNARPNACNLCHLDQTQQWTADYLHQWYSLDSPELTAVEKNVAVGVLWALQGDAGQRAIIAWHLGWEAARQACGKDWMIPTIIELMKDPYAAVRWVAFDTLRKDAAFNETQYAFDDPAAARETVANRLLDEWVAKRPNAVPSDSRGPRLLLNHQGLPDFEQINKMLSGRDDRLVAGVE